MCAERQIGARLFWWGWRGEVLRQPGGGAGVVGEYTVELGFVGSGEHGLELRTGRAPGGDEMTPEQERGGRGVGDGEGAGGGGELCDPAIGDGAHARRAAEVVGAQHQE